MTVRTIVLLLAAAVACGRDSPPSDQKPNVAHGSPSWVVRPDSFGRVPLGVPLAQAAAALGDSITVDFSTFEGCAETTPASFPAGTSVMVLKDSGQATPYLERVDVDTTGVLTAEGAGVGDSESRVLELYRGRVRVEPHKYSGPEGHYLVVTRSTDTLFLIIFETDGKRVERYRAGRRPAVEFVEGCA